jgi:hypothetical protein
MSFEERLEQLEKRLEKLEQKKTLAFGQIACCDVKGCGTEGPAFRDAEGMLHPPPDWTVFADRKQVCSKHLSNTKK